MMTLGDWIVVAVVALSGFAVVYHHALFPLYLKRRAKRKKTLPPMEVRGDLPRITVVVPAYNEAAVIASKVRNLAAMIYPADRLSVVIACDGCSDDTAVLAHEAGREPECRELDLTVLDFPENRGKVAVLNDMLRGTKADIVCLTDASAWMSIDVLLRAAGHFRDPCVGVVAGTYHLYRSGMVGEAAYWGYQRVVKEGEAALGAPLGVHGACYFMRGTALSALEPDTINDDFILPMRAVENGYKAIYDPAMVGLEMEASDGAMDFQRRCRIAAGNAQQVVRLAGLLRPRHQGIALAFASGKALRIAMPYLMIVCFFGSVLLAPKADLFFAAFVGQAVAYGAAALRAAVVPEGWSRLLDLLHYIVAGHAAGLVGSIRYAIGLEKGRWSKISVSCQTEVSS